MTLNCAILSSEGEIDSILQQIQESKDKGASLVEFRLDEFLNYAPPVVDDPLVEVSETESPDDQDETGETEEITSPAGEMKEAKIEITEVEPPKVAEVMPLEVTGAESPKVAEVVPLEVTEVEPSDVSELVPPDVAEAPVLEPLSADEGNEDTEIPQDAPAAIEIFKPDITHLDEIIKKSVLPVFVTLRGEGSGGKFSGGPEEKIPLLRQALEYSPAYLELELDDIEKSGVLKEMVAEAKERNIKTIITSYNNDNCFNEEEIEDIGYVTDGIGGDILRICCPVDTFASLANLFAASYDLKKKGKVYSYFGMGKLGHKCSIYASLLGSVMAFCTLTKKKKMDGGLMNIDSLNTQWDVLLGKWR